VENSRHLDAHIHWRGLANLPYHGIDTQGALTQRRFDVACLTRFLISAANVVEDVDSVGCFWIVRFYRKH
jgi:hypothetical protein